MRCPRCGNTEDKVVDTRPFDDSNVIRRRRECLSCQYRFATVERLEGIQMMVIKKDGSRQEFSREKIMSGLLSACSKRPISNETLIGLVNEVEAALQTKHSLEIKTDVIGEMIMERLKALDQVAYVRFASVYRDFKDVSSFTREVEQIKDKEDT